MFSCLRSAIKAREGCCWKMRNVLKIVPTCTTPTRTKMYQHKEEHQCSNHTVGIIPCAGGRILSWKNNLHLLNTSRIPRVLRILTHTFVLTREHKSVNGKTLVQNWDMKNKFEMKKCIGSLEVGHRRTKLKTWVRLPVVAIFFISNIHKHSSKIQGLKS